MTLMTLRVINHMKLFIPIVTIFFICQNNFTLEELEYLNIICNCHLSTYQKQQKAILNSNKIKNLKYLIKIIQEILFLKSHYKTARELRNQCYNNNRKNAYISFKRKFKFMFGLADLKINLKAKYNYSTMQAQVIYVYRKAYTYIHMYYSSTNICFIKINYKSILYLNVCIMQIYQILISTILALFL